VTRNADFAALVEKFVAAQLEGDRDAALAIVVDAAETVPVIDLQANVIARAQEEIGRLWQSNRVTVAQEHLATGIAQVVMARLLDRGAVGARAKIASGSAFEAMPPAERERRRSRAGVVVAVACVEGEQHDFPLRLVADFLEHAGYAVRFYGANLPTQSLVDLISADLPAALALSVTMSFNLPALRDATREVRQRFPGLPMFVGGRAIAWSPDLSRDLGVATAPADPAALVAAFDRAIQGGDPAERGAARSPAGAPKGSFAP
jgi:methanogenic corrinoid protein MtbC1